MADQKISQLPAASALTGAEIVPVVQGGANKRTTAAALTGQQGPAGPQGETGPQGPAGATGPAGVVTATAPLTYDAPTQTVAISAATTSTAGSMSAADKTKLDGIASGATANTGTVTSVALSLPALFSVTGSPVTTSGTLTAALATQAANRLLMGPSSGGDAAPTFRAMVAADLGTTLAPQFAQVGLGVAPAANVGLQLAVDVMQLRSSLTAASGVYTIDVLTGNEFVTGAAINGATTINLSNLDGIPSGYVWRGVLTFSYTSGAITWFSGNAGYTVKWDGGSAMTPTASDVETVVITVVGGTTTIEVAALRGRA